MKTFNIKISHPEERGDTSEDRPPGKNISESKIISATIRNGGAETIGAWKRTRNHDSAVETSIIAEPSRNLELFTATPEQGWNSIIQ